MGCAVEKGHSLDECSVAFTDQNAHCVRRASWPIFCNRVTWMHDHALLSWLLCFICLSDANMTTFQCRHGRILTLKIKQWLSSSVLLNVRHSAVSHVVWELKKNARKCKEKVIIKEIYSSVLAFPPVRYRRVHKVCFLMKWNCTTAWPFICKQGRNWIWKHFKCFWHLKRKDIIPSVFGSRRHLVLTSRMVANLHKIASNFYANVDSVILESSVDKHFCLRSAICIKTFMSTTDFLPAWGVLGSFMWDMLKNGFLVEVKILFL